MTVSSDPFLVLELSVPVLYTWTVGQLTRTLAPFITPTQQKSQFYRVSCYEAITTNTVRTVRKGVIGIYSRELTVGHYRYIVALLRLNLYSIHLYHKANNAPLPLIPWWPSLAEFTSVQAAYSAA